MFIHLRFLVALGTIARACAFALLLALPLSASAQQASQPTPAAAVDRGDPADYEIGPGDLLSVSVGRLSQFERTVRVSNSGRIHLPYVGILSAAGLSVAQLETTIARLLQERGLVNEPWVTIRIEQYRAQPVYILGEVINPGQFVIKDEMYLMDLITLAAGFNEVATPVGYLYRRKAVPAADGTDALEDEAISIDFKALNEGTRPELNLRLRGGDVLYVPQRRKQHFFVVGDVVQPGVFEIRAEAPPILSSQAVARAGGPLRTAKMSKGVLVRFDDQGRREELPMDFKAVLEGRKPDVPLRPNDIIFIPGSVAKTLAYGMLGAIPQVVQEAAH